MPLRDTYKHHAQARQTAALVKKMQAATADIARDILIINQRTSAKGLQRLFAPLATGFLSGAWSSEDNTLSYTMVRDEVALDHINYSRILAATRATHKDSMMTECKAVAIDDIEKHYLPAARLHIVATMMIRHGAALRDHAAYRALHAACADPTVDRRVELAVTATDSHDVRDYFIGINGVVTATPRLQVRIYLDQPYRASSDAVLTAPIAGAKTRKDFKHE